jgi:hypothetical protein
VRQRKGKCELGGGGFRMISYKGMDQELFNMLLKRVRMRNSLPYPDGGREGGHY